ncbi:MAG: dihydroorotate dehydrogenase electron transfer subunit [Lachnospiraceae bacterium]|jgi:dihydroorotate dehydrogenase electron transfer subunit|nr:dihydroorotate dehydrogenase electron transfer subunit [Lachnospiraceae bacterium]
MPKSITPATITAHNKIASDIYDLRLQTQLAQTAQPGQFVGVYPQGAATLLPRPISICETDSGKGEIRLVYRLAGRGTREFAGYQAGESVCLLGPLGNGFPLEEAQGQRLAIMGGGIGIPPLLGLAKALAGQTAATDIFLGYRDNQAYLAEEMQAYGPVHIASEDGSVGTRGHVLDGLAATGQTPSLIMACGPLAMLRAVKAFAENNAAKAYISLEERMACGIGACLGCVCRTTAINEHTHVHNARVCTEGPVFEAGEVKI